MIGYSADLPSKPHQWSTWPGAQASADPLVGAMIGEYRVIARAGVGGMGTVYAAEHPVIHKRAAIKIIHPHLAENAEMVERFIQEARAVNQIHHPNIVDIFSLGRLADGRPYFIMEWLEGQSLLSRVARAPLTFAEGLAIIDTVCRAMEAAHAKGIVHRDLNPANIFLTQFGDEAPRVTILDFGIAKLRDVDHSREPGAIYGTPAYLAPEQARAGRVTDRTDVYGLGATAFEMFTGRPLFDDANAMEVLAAHVMRTPPLPSDFRPDMPPPLERLVLEMLDKDATMRPSMRDVREATAEIANRLSKVPTLAQTVAEVPTLRLASEVTASDDIDMGQKRSRRAIVSVLAGAGVLVLTIIGGSRWFSSDAPPAPEVEQRAETVEPAPLPAPSPTPAEPPPPSTPRPRSDFSNALSGLSQQVAAAPPKEPVTSDSSSKSRRSRKDTTRKSAEPPAVKTKAAELPPAAQPPSPPTKKKTKDDAIADPYGPTK